MTKLTRRRLGNESGAFANYKLAFTRVSATSLYHYIVCGNNFDKNVNFSFTEGIKGLVIRCERKLRIIYFLCAFFFVRFLFFLFFKKCSFD